MIDVFFRNFRSLCFHALTFAILLQVATVIEVISQLISEYPMIVIALAADSTARRYNADDKVMLKFEMVRVVWLQYHILILACSGIYVPLMASSAAHSNTINLRLYRISDIHPT